MSAALDSRAAAIRDYLGRHGIGGPLAGKYAVIAARWEQLRLLARDGQATPADDARFRELSRVLSVFSDRLALPVVSDGPEVIAGVTGFHGFLPFDPQRLLPGETWSSAAAGWQQAI